MARPCKIDEMRESTSLEIFESLTIVLLRDTIHARSGPMQTQRGLINNTSGRNSVSPAQRARAPGGVSDPCRFFPRERHGKQGGRELHDGKGRVGRNAALVVLVARHEDVAGHAPAGAPRVAHRPVIGAGRGAVADHWRRMTKKNEQGLMIYYYEMKHTDVRWEGQTRGLDI
jgi:hypothetical protein